MVVFLICAVLGIGAMLFMFKSLSFGSNLEIFDVVASVLLGSMFGMALYLFVSIIIVVGLPTEKVTYNTEIYALQDNITQQGSFFLGSGNVSGTMKYYYLTKNEDGVTMNTIDATSVVIVESFDKPHLEIQKSRVKDSFWKEQVIFSDFEPTLKTKIYITKGSIKYGFNVDLK